MKTDKSIKEEKCAIFPLVKVPLGRLVVISDGILLFSLKYYGEVTLFSLEFHFISFRRDREGIDIEICV